MKILVCGNPIDGFEFIGPFEETEDISEDYTKRYDEWWIVNVTSPEESRAIYNT